MKKVFIIAEAGVNHNGDIELAVDMIDAAKRAGADAVKFQTFKAEKLVSKYANKAEYQKNMTGSKDSQYEMIKKYELDVSVHKKLITHAKDRGIEFLSTAFDLESIDMLNELGLKTFKISSGDLTNLPYLRKVGALRKKIILSTGMSTMEEIDAALKVLVDSGTLKRDITVLHCNTEYPTPFEDVNLKAMVTIKERFGVEVGYSDHTLGLNIPVAAVALGASVIEKHFTLNKNMPGPDHKASLDPNELKLMVTYIREMELALGSGIKVPSKSETKNMTAARKSIVAIKDVKRGELFSVDNIGVKRPGNGISPMKWDSVIGKAAKKNFMEDELIEL